ncbi:MAG TPA: hypothetical protein PLV65_12230, partial [Tenuifilaceae bacterium]|nr:hypothetical protein [Tenuifilaceae bacterium]
GDTIMDMEWPDLTNDFEFLNDDYSVTLKFKVTNEMPLDMYLQIVTLLEVGDELVPDYYFIEDPENTPLASSAILDPNGISISPSTAYLTITLTKEEYEQIASSNHLVLLYTLKTGGGEQVDVKILSTNHIQVQMSMLVSGTIQVEL